MKNTISILVLVAMLCIFSLDGNAEVIVIGPDVTANLEGVSFSKVMGQIGKQADIHIDVLNRSDYNEAMISEVFENVPLEQGLDHLLNGWNYGMSKDLATGEVRMIVIGSRRKSLKDGEIASMTQHRVESWLDEHTMPHSRLTSVAENSEQLFAGQSNSEHPDRDQGEDWEGLPEEEPASQTEEELLANAPPSVRSFIERMLERDGQKQAGITLSF